MFSPSKPCFGAIVLLSRVKVEAEEVTEVESLQQVAETVTKEVVESCPSGNEGREGCDSSTSPTTERYKALADELNAREDIDLRAFCLFAMAARKSEDQLELQRASELRVELTRDNIASLFVLGFLVVLGCLYLFKWVTRHQCHCRLCKGHYSLTEHLGSGGYGEVFVVHSRAENSAGRRTFCAKRIPVSDITEAEDYAHEAKELVRLRHRHIVSYEDDFVHTEQSPTSIEPNKFFFIVMEFCVDGDLKDRIESSYHALTEERTMRWFHQLTLAVQYLHSKGIIHRDLKSQNVFLTAAGDVRLGDFGLCRSERGVRTSHRSTLTHAGTDCYMAPEMLNSSSYGKPADIWGLGCILYELLAGEFMWELDGILGAMILQKKHFLDGLMRKIPEVVSPCTRKLLRALLDADPSRRPTGTEILRRRVFRKSTRLSRARFGGDAISNVASSQALSSTQSEADDSEPEEEEEDDGANYAYADAETTPESQDTNSPTERMKSTNLPRRALRRRRPRKGLVAK
jgi:NIMA (never in mitosis gene a)-related kinase